MVCLPNEAQGERQLAETLLRTHMAQGPPGIVVTCAAMAAQVAKKLLEIKHTDRRYHASSK